MAIARDWDGRSYDRISAPMEQLGRETLDRLTLRGDETVLDAGCGTGRVTRALAERLPRGRVIGVDGSAAMIAVARERLGPGVELRVQDLLALDLGGEQVDAILSTATFHWIADHDALFAALRRALRPGGALVAQCGGEGNVAAVYAAGAQAGAGAPFAAHLGDWRGPWRFAGPQETERRLRAAGFATARAWLETRPVAPEEPREYLRTIILGAHLERLPEELREPFVDAVLDRLGPRPTIDYVRLNIDATA
jgi:trans-aconitate 2-methyltransferase